MRIEYVLTDGVAYADVCRYAALLPIERQEKIDRLRYALRRYRQTHSEADYEAHKTKTLNNLENGINFYQAFNLDQFKHRNQYRHIEHLIDKLSEKD